MHSCQNFAEKNRQIQATYLAAKAADPEAFAPRLNFSWSNWGFGMEDLDVSCARLADAGLGYIELHGNHYGPDLGYAVDSTLDTLARHGLRVSGVCGMFSSDNDLSSNRPVHQQEAIAYLRREVEFTAAVSGHYLLVVPGAVGRPVAYDDAEKLRATEALARVADIFPAHGIKAAIEPIRSAEVSIIHTVAEAIELIEELDHPGVQHINGDIYHMQVEESHIPSAVIEAGDRLVNLHLADSNRRALGEGSMDLDTLIMALYLIGHNAPGRFVTAEPLGPGSDPYSARTARPDGAALDTMVHRSVAYFRQREDAVRALS